MSSEPLISPCNCSGSVGLIHKSCLEKWLTAPNNSKCEICRHEYQVIYKPKSWKEWILGTRFGATHKNLTTDIFCFFILTPLVIISAYLCGSGAAYYLTSHNYSIKFVGLSLLASFLEFLAMHDDFVFTSAVHIPYDVVHEQNKERT
jgi:E3 ubiquitin-protein ligase MARCH2